MELNNKNLCKNPQILGNEHILNNPIDQRRKRKLEEKYFEHNENTLYQWW